MMTQKLKLFHIYQFAVKTMSHILSAILLACFCLFTFNMLQTLMYIKANTPNNCYLLSDFYSNETRSF